jgi:serine/threonine-protein kinase PknG
VPRSVDRFTFHLARGLGVQFGPALAMPLGTGKSLAGVLVTAREPGSPPYDEHALKLVATFADHAALALRDAENEWAKRELRVLADRDRIARDMHDQVLQQLYGVGMAMQSTQQRTQAPEVATIGTSVASDIFTIGRTLLVLAMEFRGYQSTYLASLPPVGDTPLFQAHDSLYRLLAKTCAPDPADRFASADELRVQLLGVLREVVADRPGAAAAAYSTSSLLFDVPTVSGQTLDWPELPALRVDEHDPMTAWLQTVSIQDPAARLDALRSAPQPSAEVLLATATAALRCGRLEAVDTAVVDMLTADPWEWRAVWMSGLAALSRDDYAGAQSAFNAVYGQVPGELAPKLALALACEASGELDVAESLYTTCARTDANYIAPCAFGLSRIRSGRGDLDGAISALDLVPPTSRAFIQARRERAGKLAASGRGLPALSEAMNSLESLTLDARDRATLFVSVLDAALDEVNAKGPQPNILIARLPATESSLRGGLESAYRELAGYADSREDTVRLVDRANSVRNWTLR